MRHFINSSKKYRMTPFNRPVGNLVFTVVVFRFCLTCVSLFILFIVDVSFFRCPPVASVRKSFSPKLDNYKELGIKSKSDIE